MHLKGMYLWSKARTMLSVLFSDLLLCNDNNHHQVSTSGHGISVFKFYNLLPEGVGV